MRVTHIAPRDQGGYGIRYLDHRTGRTSFFICDRLVLAAGALGTTELLLRNRDRFPLLSPVLGKRFSGNGDLLGFMFSADLPVHPSKGPVITGTVRFRTAAAGTCRTRATRRSSTGSSRAARSAA
ncbi:hypothetical protein [Lentzea tibetensis]|uniref:hypothetical protein n=1 Tax=Lentzea tibetensis TaxID=2591470 RepID=UPI001F249E2E|nr:hypothetical protein [Lentzea tibetensis]